MARRSSFCVSNLWISFEVRMFTAAVRCCGIARRYSPEISPHPSNAPPGSTFGEQVSQQLGAPLTIERQGKTRTPFEKCFDWPQMDVCGLCKDLPFFFRAMAK